MSTLAWLLLACTEYELGSGKVVLPGEADSGAGDSAVDTGGPPGPDDPGCEDGYYADYFNLPADHPDVEGAITGVQTGDLPSNHDWYDQVYFAFRQLDPGLEFGDQWWPVDQGLPGDPQYFSVHWSAWLQVDADLETSFEMGSDDDSWAFIDGELVADLGGVHGVETTTFDRTLAAGRHRLELYMAERHTSDSGFWFRWDDPAVRIYTCP